MNTKKHEILIIHSYFVLSIIYVCSTLIEKNIWKRKMCIRKHLIEMMKHTILINIYNHYHQQLKLSCINSKHVCENEKKILQNNEQISNIHNFKHSRNFHEMKMMKITKKMLSEKHSFTLINMHNLVFIWKTNTKTINLMNECVRLRIRILNVDYFDTLFSRRMTNTKIEE